MTTAVAEARAIVATRPDAPAVIVRGPWPVGIVGLVASRLVDDGSRPAVVGAELGDTIRASCRSDGVLDLGAALEQCADLFTALRRPRRRRRVRDSRSTLAGLRRAVRGPRRRQLCRATRGRRSGIDLAVPALDVDYALHRDLAALAPYGPGNPTPARRGP